MKVKSDWNNKHVVISRTDSIGDVILTLPLCAFLKEKYPNITITFLCKNYTASIVKNYKAVDHLLILDELQQLNHQAQVEEIRKYKFDAIVHVFPNKSLGKLFRKAKIPIRIGTSHRLHHLLTCNIRPNFTRKGSDLHESQLNFKLIESLGFTEIPTLDEINNTSRYFEVRDLELPSYLEHIDFAQTVCLHPKSQGSAVEWPVEKYMELAEDLVQAGKTVFFTGTEKEGLQFRNEIPKDSKIIDTTGKLTIDQLQFLIKKSQALVACSTGPLHIAAILGKKAVGLYAPRIPIHPGRWKPIGPHAIALINDENCETCAKGQPCDCITKISIGKVFKELNN